MRLTAHHKRRTVRRLERQLAAARRAYEQALAADQLEREARRTRTAAARVAADQRERERIITRAARHRKAPWYERVRVRLLYPTIGGTT